MKNSNTTQIANRATVYLRQLSFIKSTDTYRFLITMLFVLTCSLTCWGCFRQPGNEECWLLYVIRSQTMIHSLFNYYLSPFSENGIVFFRLAHVVLVFSGVTVLSFGLYAFFGEAFLLKKSDRKYLVMMALTGYMVFAPPVSMVLSYWHMIVFINTTGLGLLFLGLSSHAKYESVFSLIAGVLFIQIFFLQVPAVVYVLVPLALLLIHRKYVGTCWFLFGNLLGVFAFFIFVLDFNQFLIYFETNYMHVVNTVGEEDEIHGLTRLVYNATCISWYFAKEALLAFLALYGILNFQKPGKKFVGYSAFVPVVFSLGCYLRKECAALKGKAPLVAEFQSFEPILFIVFFLLFCYIAQSSGKFELQLPRLKVRELAVITMLLFLQPLTLAGCAPDYYVVGNRTLCIYYAFIFLMFMGGRNFLGSIQMNRPEADTFQYMESQRDEGGNNLAVESITESRGVPKGLQEWHDVAMLFVLFGSLLVQASYLWLSSWTTATSLIQERYAVRYLNPSWSPVLCSYEKYMNLHKMKPYMEKAKVLAGYYPYGFFWTYVIMFDKEVFSHNTDKWTAEDFCTHIRERKLTAEQFVIIYDDNMYDRRLSDEETLDAFAQLLGSDGWRKIVFSRDTRLVIFPKHDKQENEGGLKHKAQ